MNAEQLLEKLDPEQRAAAEALVGPTCILAGAGTGKTTTVTHRIAYGIAKGHFAANRVLALTYTNRAAGELRQRLRQLQVGAVSVKTFHAAALSQLEYFWPQFAGVPAPRVIESKARMLAEAAEKLKIFLDAAALRDLAAEVEWRKYSMLSMHEYAEAAKQRTQPNGLSLNKNLEVQVAYEEAKAAAQRIDWEDVLVLTLGMLRAEPIALAHVQQQYRFFTVDEYQDISPLQQALLDAWLGGRSDLCVVGDPNQTIYSFSGASSEYLRGFSSRFPDATVVELTRNYRSTQQILDFANRLTSQSSLQPLQSQGAIGVAPQITRYQDVVAEAASIAEQISELISSGTRPNEIAILYRVNGQSEPLENALSSHGIEYQLRGGQRFFNRTEVIEAMRMVRALAAGQGESNKSLYESVSEICRSLGWQANLNAISFGAGHSNEASVAVRERWESLNALLSIVEELPEASTLADFARELDERQRSQHEPIRAAVTLATIHAAKGLEWDAVFIVGLTEGYLPISYANSEAELAEERRLLYVGLTRARKILKLSWPAAAAAKSTGGSSGFERSPSRFLAELSR